MSDHFTFDPARFLTVRYLIALTALGVLAICAQWLIQHVLSKQEGDARIINLAGRQRMLSQELAKAALSRRLAGTALGRAHADQEIEQVIREMARAQERLVDGQGTPGMGRANSPTVAEAFRQEQPILMIMCDAAHHVGDDPQALDRVLANQSDFLERMDRIVLLYETEAGGRVSVLMRLELIICACLLLTLLAEAALVFRPAVRQVRAGLRQQERLRQQQRLTREMELAAEVSRVIGCDLHDGVGQILTALTLQTKAVELRLTGHAQAGEITRIRSGIAEALVQVRVAAHGLCPIDIQVDGLDKALARLANATRLVAGIDCRASCDPIESCRASEPLYRIAQEAISNALRHGHARTIHIILNHDGAAGQLVICDDGAAPQDAPPVAQGMGLRSMRWRAGNIGAHFEAGPQAGGGWRVSCRFPIERDMP